MATWGSSVDVLADLDRLSEFSAGCNYTKDIPIESYSSYGRGSVIQERESSSPPPCPGLKTFDEDECFSQPTLTFGYGAGRGERILALNRHREESSLQQQLRMAMGPGFSNELIEDFIRGDSSSEHSGQFEDIQEESAVEDPATEDTSVLRDSTTDDSGTSLGTPLPLSSSSPSTSISPVSCSAEETTLDTKTAVAEVKRQKRSPRRNRNALINNLISNRDKEKDITTEKINETKNKFTSPTKFNRDSIKRSEVAVFNPEPVDVIDDIYTPNLPIKNSNNFYLREEDFPPL
ncbi:uncharacterized protein [Periplaneta americana]|uniref:uncharacterized protein n=1 Tax=Periplaneta americana TaxID=6978 RepID=UPI0037E8F153